MPVMSSDTEGRAVMPRVGCLGSRTIQDWRQGFSEAGTRVTIFLRDHYGSCNGGRWFLSKRGKPKEEADLHKKSETCSEPLFEKKPDERREGCDRNRKSFETKVEQGNVQERRLIWETTHIRICPLTGQSLHTDVVIANRTRKLAGSNIADFSFFG